MVYRTEAIEGALLGCAVGDALGLPMEGLSAKRIQKFHPGPDDLTRYHFIAGRGMISDDTEHTIAVARSLARSGGEVERFAQELASELRRWVLAAPAGIGFATLRACLKLLFFVSPDKSGVYSAGNGPAMRAGIIGATYGHDENRMAELVKASTVITHTDEAAYYGSLAVAVAAHQSAVGEWEGEAYLERLKRILLETDEKSEKLLELAEKAIISGQSGEKTADFVQNLGFRKGVSGYINCTVPAALQAWQKHRTALIPALVELIECGGDTDTVAAIAGSIIGAGVGPEGIGQASLEGLIEWPNSVDYMRELAKTTAESIEKGPILAKRAPFPLILARNFFFTIIVLTHGFRRLAPPY